MDVRSLLAGPRGRRLCLQLAMALDDAVFQLEFRLAYDMDPGRGTSRVMLTFEDPETALGDGEEANALTCIATPGLVEEVLEPSGADMAAISPPGALENLAEHLLKVDALELSEEILLHALLESVDSAAYWQEPGGEDILAAHPLLRPGLERIAATVLESPHSRWWSRPRQSEQWIVHFPWEHQPAPSLPADFPRALADWGRSTTEAEAEALREQAQHPDAACSGEWWSFPDGMPQSTGLLPGGQPVGLVLVEDSFGPDEATSIPVTGVGKTYEMASAEDWVALCREFPLDVTASKRHDWFHVSGRDGTWVVPDWEQVAQRWDAVHLSSMGYLNAATRALDVGPDSASMIAGWGPDTTVWLTDLVEEGPPERRIAWRRSESEDPWARV